MTIESSTIILPHPFQQKKKKKDRGCHGDVCDIANAPNIHGLDAAAIPRSIAQSMRVEGECTEKKVGC